MKRQPSKEFAREKIKLPASIWVLQGFSMLVIMGTTRKERLSGEAPELKS